MNGRNWVSQKVEPVGIIKRTITATGSRTQGLHHSPKVEWSQKNCSIALHTEEVCRNVARSERMRTPSPIRKKQNVSKAACSATQLRSATAAVSQLSPAPWGD